MAHQFDTQPDLLTNWVASIFVLFRLGPRACFCFQVFIMEREKRTITTIILLLSTAVIAHRPPHVTGAAAGSESPVNKGRVRAKDASQTRCIVDTGRGRLCLAQLRPAARRKKTLVRALRIPLDSVNYRYRDILCLLLKTRGSVQRS